MIFSAIGDLVLDIYYDENLKYIGCDGGITSANIVCNLSMFNFKTKCYGVCGNDYFGKLATKSLVDCNVKPDIKVLDNINTRAYYIIKREKENSFRSSKFCPFCNMSSWYFDSYLDSLDIIKKIKDNEILIFDNLNIKNQYIIDNTKNIKLCDLGLFEEFENLSKKQIINKIKNKFTIVNLNQRVEKYLLEKLELKGDLELKNIFKAKLLIITRGTKGCDFVYRNKIYNYPLDKISNEVDDSGAGDMFFATIIKNWANNNFKFTSTYFKKWFREASSNSSKIVTLIGSRAMIKKLYTEKLIKYCECEN